MPSGQQIALQPALTQVLAQHFHDAAIGRQMVVYVEGFSHPHAVAGIEDRAETV